jgi:hypothetical protein
MSEKIKKEFFGFSLSILITHLFSNLFLREKVESEKVITS